MKVGIFGCKSTTIFLLESLLDKFDIKCVITITPDDGAKNQVADYTDVTTFCNDKEIKVYQANRYDLKSSKDFEFFKDLKLDIAFVIGWQRLVPKNILETFSVGVFGMHGSTDDLPIGRGRSPMNWGLIEKRKHFFTNIFKYDPGVDSGDILDTFVFSIQPTDTSETMHYKNVLAMKTLIINNIDNILSKNLQLTQQGKHLPTHYPKRSPEDSLINWKYDIFHIEALIRAVTTPFNGAYTYLNNQKIIIIRASIFETDLVDFGFRNLQWGTIVEIFPSNKFLITCRGGLLLVDEYQTETNIVRGYKLDNANEETTNFQLNEFGYHDLP